MTVTQRVESLAIELYDHDMGTHQGEWMPWDKVIDRVRTSYRRQAQTVVNTKWFQDQIDAARYGK